MGSSLAITASAGSQSATIDARRPSWADMKKHYPDKLIPTEELYLRMIGGDAKGYFGDPAYENTCAVRMSYGLNRCGIKLGMAPSGKDGTWNGGDGYKYWIRVDDVKAELMSRFKGSDEELVLKHIPNSMINDFDGMSRIFKERVKQGQDFIDQKIAGRNGIIVFETRGISNSTGHFTLWDGTARSLAYAAGHDVPDDKQYYFWMTRLAKTKHGLVVVQVAKIKFWELK